MKQCANEWQALKSSGKADGVNYQAWMQQCMASGGPSPRVSKSVSPPSTDGVPPKSSTAKCRDGTYTSTRVRAGACARHGGVERWLQPV
ncbi:hypothetical protein DJ018_10835 [Phenylobacterium deserti]|uniref:DUF3761 domain-containing protein n=2 Tax=Phenylobacterium deserti TaxID=1914756 RepID=A0A328ADM5_9CAUL|nr:hypothetical protein DJ018_10835 [Phenylobacterium deserti]